MIRLGPLVFAVAGYALLCAPAAPQGTQPENEDSRFSFFRADDGFLRLDGRTGQVSLCTRREVGWLCLALPEERAAFEGDCTIGRGRLKKEVLAKPAASPESGRSAGGRRRTQRGGRASGHGRGREVWRRLVAMI